VVDAAQSGLSSASGGNLVLQSQSGALTVGTAVNANASGNVLLQASAGAVNVQALVQSGSGAISVLGSSGVVLSANMGVSTGTGTGAGTLDVESSGGSVLMGSNSELQASANVNVQAAQSIGLAQIVSGAGVALTASAGSISNATQASNNVTAQTLYLNAGAGAGQSAQALQTQVNTLSAALGSAGLYLRNDQTLSSNSVSVSVGKVGLNGATSVVTQATLADAIVSAGTVVLQTSSGDVNLNSASASVAAIKANGSANVLVQALAGAVSVNANVQNGSAASVGNVSLQALGANANVVVGSNGVAVSVSDGAGSVDVESGAGSVVMGANSVLSSQSGNVRLAGAQNVVLAQVSTGASVSVKAGAGSITDANGNLNSNSAGVQNVVASALMLNAAGSVGVASDALRTQVSTVSAVAGAGGIALLNDQSETVGTVAVSVNQVNALGATDLVSDAALAGLFTSANGNITLQSTVGDITLTSATNTNPSGVPAISANGSGNVLVQTLSSSASVNVLGNIVSGSGNINVLGGLNVVLYTPATGAALIGTGTPGLVNVLAGAGEVISGGTTQPGQTVNLNSNTLSLQAPLIGSGNLLNIAPATGSGTPAAVVVGGTPANAAGALYLSQAQTALIQAGFSDVQIGSSRAGQVVSLVGQNGQGVASNNSFVNPLILLANGSGATVSIAGGLQGTTLQVQGSGSGTTLASAAVSMSGSVQVNDNVLVSGTSSLVSGTSGAADLSINGNITGGGISSALSLSAGGGNVVVQGAISNLGQLHVSQVGNLSFASSVSIVGNVVINSTGVVSFLGPLTIAAGGSLTINGSNQVSFGGTANFGTGVNVLIASNVLNLNGGAGSLTGSGVLTLQGKTPSTAIQVGAQTITGALNIGSTALSAIAPGFQQLVLGTVDANTGHASAAAGSVSVDGSTNLSVVGTSVAVYASSITVSAGGTGVSVGGVFTLDAVGVIQVGSNVTTTTAAAVSLSSATAAVQMAAQTQISTQGGNVAIVTGNNSTASIATIDTRAGGAQAGIVNINVQSGQVLDANDNDSANVYATAMSMNGYGLFQSNSADQGLVLKVRAPVVQVLAPQGAAVADAGENGRTNYNLLNNGSVYEELVVLGGVTRVTIDPATLLTQSTAAMLVQGLSMQEIVPLRAGASGQQFHEQYSGRNWRSEQRCKPRGVG